MCVFKLTSTHACHSKLKRKYLHNKEQQSEESTTAENIHKVRHMKYKYKRSHIWLSKNDGNAEW